MEPENKIGTSSAAPVELPATPEIKSTPTDKKSYKVRNILLAVLLISFVGLAATYYFTQNGSNTIDTGDPIKNGNDVSDGSNGTERDPEKTDGTPDTPPDEAPSLYNGTAYAYVTSNFINEEIVYEIYHTTDPKDVAKKVATVKDGSIQQLKVGPDGNIYFSWTDGQKFTLSTIDYQTGKLTQIISKDYSEASSARFSFLEYGEMIFDRWISVSDIMAYRQISIISDYGKGTESNLLKLEPVQVDGRGGSPFDSQETIPPFYQKLSIFAMTDSFRQNQSFTTELYVYGNDTGDNAVLYDAVPNSTHFVAVGGDGIDGRYFYINPTTEKSYIYDYNSKKSTILSGMPLLQNAPEYSGTLNGLIFSNETLDSDHDDISVQYYDFETNKSKILVTGARAPKWISDNEFLALETVDCGQECGLVNYSNGALNLYKIEEDGSVSKKEINDSNAILYTGFLN